MKVIPHNKGREQGPPISSQIDDFILMVRQYYYCYYEY